MVCYSIGEKWKTFVFGGVGIGRLMPLVMFFLFLNNVMFFLLSFGLLMAMMIDSYGGNNKRGV